MPLTTSSSAISLGLVACRRLNGEQLPGQPRAAPDRDLNLLRLGARGFGFGQLHQHEICRPDDAHEDVVEVVCDAACQPADRFQLLRLPQLLFERAPFGDVANESRQPGPVAFADARDRELHGELRAVGAHGDGFERAVGERAAAGREVPAQRRHLHVADGRGHQHLQALAQDAQPRPSEHPLGGRIELADLHAGVRRDDGVRCRFEDRALAGFALHARAIHLPREIQRQRSEQQRQPVAAAFHDGDDHRRRAGAQQVVRCGRRELRLPDDPGVLVRRERDGEGDRQGVHDEIRDRHAEERQRRRESQLRRAPEPLIDLARGLNGQDETGHVEERSVRRIPLARAEDCLAPAARRADDHRRVRTTQDQREDVDDVRHRHVRAASDRELNLECRCQRRQDGEGREGKNGRELGARQQQDERRGAAGDDRNDVPACARRQVPEQGETVYRAP